MHISWKPHFFKPWRYQFSLSPFWRVAFRGFGSIWRRYDRSWPLMLLPVAGDRSTVAGVTAPFRRVTRWFIQQTHGRESVFTIVCGFFSRIKNATLNWDANSWEDNTSANTNSLGRSRDDRAIIAPCSSLTSIYRHTDIFKESYSIDELITYCQQRKHVQFCRTIGAVLSIATVARALNAMPLRNWKPENPTNAERISQLF